MAVSTKTVAIVNYGMGNIGSVANALAFLDGRYIVASRKEELKRAGAYILPGVGAFAVAMENLRRQDLVEELNEQVLEKKKPFLGICLGMQLLAEDSVEHGLHGGLNWIGGHVRALEPSNGLCVPHVGWNDVKVHAENPLFKGIQSEAFFFFDHSYHLICSGDAVLATSDYGSPFVAAIRSENIFATQFHPEKSQRNGLRLMRNFLNFAETC